MGRADSLAKLAWAYGLHQARRRVSRPKPELSALLDTYSPEGIRPLTRAEFDEHPRLVTCINCGLCAFAATRMGKTRLPDLAVSYMRLYARVGDAASDVADEPGGAGPDFAAASAVCPVGLPLEDVAAVVRRLTAG